MVLVLVTGILAVVALPRFDLLKGFDEIGYRDKVKATLEFARKSAVAQRRYSCVTVSGNDLVVTIDTNVPEGYAGGCPAAVLALPAADRACSPAAVNKVCAPTGVTLAASASPLVFSPLGQPSGAAGAGYTVTGQNSATITVERETGYVH